MDSLTHIVLGGAVGYALYARRLGRLAFFVPAIAAREVLLQRSALRTTPRSRFVPFLALSICLALSAFYELVEWWAAVFTGESATAFLGTQGDVWDTQWDMFLCLVGASVSLLVLTRRHDRALARLRASTGDAP